MASEIRSFQPVIPAGTPTTAPVTRAMVFDTNVVERIDIRVPPGPNGLVGFRIAAGGTQIIPYAAGQWLVASDQLISWPLSDQIESGSWALIGYNLGAYAHTIYVTFLLRPPDVERPSFTPLPPSMLSGTL